MKDIRNFGIILMMTFFLAFMYVILKWPYTPEDVMADLAYIGPYGFLIDAAIIFMLYKWYTNRKKNVD